MQVRKERRKERGKGQRNKGRKEGEKEEGRKERARDVCGWGVCLVNSQGAVFRRIYEHCMSIPAFVK